MAQRPTKRPRFLWVVLAVAFLTCNAVNLPAVAADPQFPPLTGRVVDEAGLLSPTARERISGWLEQYERQSKRQVVVATVKSLQGYPIEDFGYRLGRFWGIGEKDRNTGAILLVAPNERAVRIEVGYGLEGDLTDAISRTIIERDILPTFRQGNYEQGITAGTVSILRALGWSGAADVAQPNSDNTAGNLAALIPLLIIVFLVMFSHSRRGLWLLPIVSGMWGARSRGGFSGGRSFGGGGGSFGGGGASGRW